MKYSETVICNDALIQASKPPPPSRFQRSVQLEEDPPEFCEFPEYDKSQLPPNRPVVVTLSVSLSVSTKGPLTMGTSLAHPLGILAVCKLPMFSSCF